MNPFPSAFEKDSGRDFPGAVEIVRDAHAAHDGPMRSIAVVGAKGGVGKTSLVVSLAIAAAESGKRVLLFDGDLALGKVSLLLGLAPRWTLFDVLAGERTLEEILITGPSGIHIVPAALGIEAMADLDDYRQETLLLSLQKLSRRYDALFIDTATGIQRQTLRLARSAQEALVLMTPEIPALADAYSTVKALASRRPACALSLVVSMNRGEVEAERAARRLQRLSRRYLGFAPPLRGAFPLDSAVRHALARQRPFVLLDPEAPASRAARRLSRMLLEPSAGEALQMRAAVGE
ncbi:MAG: MinD/ParA family protein [Candidatus Eisenbacteria bacterium]|nr:MinD/ParA family protein [Candidatus Eisenbacteria bacterium]